MKVEIKIDDKLFNKDVDEFINVVTGMIQLYAKKNHDYGNSFDEGMNKIGLAYGIGRIYDKVNRLVNFLNTTFVVDDEKFTDTLEDLANYSVMLRAWINSNDSINNIVNNDFNNRTIRFNNEEPILGNYDISQSDAD